jgi:hypothetical protein
MQQQQSQSGPVGPSVLPGPPGQSKYAQLLAVIEEMGKDIRPTYAGSKSSAERLKRGIVNARILVRECLMETERSARQWPSGMQDITFDAVLHNLLEEYMHNKK